MYFKLPSFQFHKYTYDKNDTIISGMKQMVEADHCTVACADSAGDQCGGPRGALSVYLSGSLASGPLDTAATVLRDEAGGAISGAVETGKDVYLEVKQGEFICTVIKAVHIAKWNFASQYFTQAIIDKELEN